MEKLSQRPGFVHFQLISTKLDDTTFGLGTMTVFREIRLH